MNDVIEDSNPASTIEPVFAGSRRKSRIYKAIVGVLALFGLFSFAVLMYAIFRKDESKTEPAEQYTMDEMATVASLMEENYGKYSSSLHGWTYVSPEGNTYLVTVVQQKKMTDSTSGHEVLYFVTSGTLIAKGAGSRENEKPMPLYGAFRSVLTDDGMLYTTSTPYGFTGTVPLTPERVKFEALNEDHWGWVLRQITEDDDVVWTRTEILIPTNDEVKEAASFTSAEDNTKAVLKKYDSCAKASEQHNEWVKRTSTSALPEEVERMKNGGVPARPMDTEPTLCINYIISYRTDKVAGKFFTPFYLTLSGVKGDQPQEKKNWKIMLDQKSMTYLLPSELKDSVD